jgi:hypothetical protein
LVVELHAASAAAPMLQDSNKNVRIERPSFGPLSVRAAGSEMQSARHSVGIDQLVGITCVGRRSERVPL